MKIIKNSTLFCFLFLLLNLKLFSIEFFDTKGRDFWLTFLPNAHKNASTMSSDSLFIFISSDKSTSGTIEYYDRNGRFFSVPFSINTPGDLYTFQLQYYNYELWGYTTDNNKNVRYNSEITSKLAFHINSIEEVTVYAHSQAQNTSDAFLVFPTDVLGKSYTVASFNSDGHYNNTTTDATPSEFAIIATEDNTNILIKPKEKTQYNGLNYQTISMNKGDVYLVQAKISSPDYKTDLSGSKITSDKPISVFGGHQKATVPVVSISSGSRDFLAEQIPPDIAWGKSAFVTPFTQPTGASFTEKDIYRVFASNDSTEIYVDNIKKTTLNNGEYYQDNINYASAITSNKQIMLVQYKRTADNSGGSKLGDPFMLIVPPKEQYMNSYTTINVQARESGSKVYTEQYITFVIHKNAINSLKLDGVNINSSNFKQISNTEFMYANLVVTDGIHRTQADSTFGIYIYGYGIANSFGYTGGMSFKPIDFQAPQFSYKDSCYSVYGVVTDSLQSDYGIMSISVADTGKVNTIINLEDLKNNNRISEFKASLIDKKFDGKFTINSLDSLNQFNTKTFDIKGFTLGINNIELLDSTLDFSAKIMTGSSKCYKIALHNYGKFNQAILDVIFNNKVNFYTTKKFPWIIKPGEIDTITICATSKIDTSVTEFFKLINECGDVKQFAKITLKTGYDRFPPKYLIKSDSCGFNYNIFVSDTSDWDSGIKEFEILNKINCNISFESDGKIAKVNISRISADFDMIFGVSFLDSIGNKVFYRDTIYSSSISISSLNIDSNTEKVKNFGHTEIGDPKIDSIKLFNNGNRTVVLNDVLINKNINFSVPMNQFPLSINSKDSTFLRIIFYPFKSDTNALLDTLILNFGCLDNIIQLKGVGDLFIDTTKDNCNSNIILVANKIPFDANNGLVYPNPFSIFSKVIVNNPNQETSLCKIELIDALGQTQKLIFENNIPFGNYEITIDATEINSGTYYLKIYNNGLFELRKIIIIK